MFNFNFQQNKILLQIISTIFLLVVIYNYITFFNHINIGAIWEEDYYFILIVVYIYILIWVYCLISFFYNIYFLKLKRDRTFFKWFWGEFKNLNFLEKFQTFYFTLFTAIPIKILITPTFFNKTIRVILLFLIWIFSLETLFYVVWIFVLSLMTETYIFYLMYENVKIFKMATNKTLFGSNELLATNYFEFFIGKNFKTQSFKSVLFFFIIPTLIFLILSYIEDIELNKINILLDTLKKNSPELIYSFSDDKIHDVHVIFKNLKEQELNLILKHTFILKIKYTIKNFFLYFFKL